ncbi:uncharacterized protein BXIN_0910 [Babesia sp. Xinjiang]|uniref:uncharacterized protein n=1 Tax=Babesia sp. Xinjiang TaxID=462227 RepID=UPI000A26615D|nr:uncharacterized protein BXIN_0910 [Babesia sp. Xinjiang]ORM42039.1 hypothetical protein BXIN_0910 [Babesia sp. Xinjiang]
MPPNSITELIGSSYKVIVNLLVNNKRVLSGTNSTAFLQHLERSLPNHFWDLNTDHVAVLLFTSLRSSSRASPAVRSLCARLCNIYDDAERASYDRGSSNNTRSTLFDLEHLVVVTWCLDRLSSRKTEVQLPKMVRTMAPSLLHWIDEGITSLSNASGTLTERLPPDAYAKMCTVFVCLSNAMERSARCDTTDGLQEKQSLNVTYAHLAELILQMCISDCATYRSLPADSRHNQPFEVAYEAYIACSLSVLMVLLGHGFSAASAISSYFKLIEMLDFTQIKNVEILVQTFNMMSTEKNICEITETISNRLLDEIGTRELHDLPNDQLYSFLRGCSSVPIQHLDALEAVSDALIQRSHQLPDLPKVIEMLEYFTKLSYHNSALLEMFVRHVQNNAESATRAQLSSMLESCGISLCTATKVEIPRRRNRYVKHLVISAPQLDSGVSHDV